MIKSLIASAKDWTNPKGPTLLGPFRLAERPKIFRSSNTKKATLTKVGRTKLNHEKICLIIDSSLLLQSNALLSYQNILL